MARIASGVNACFHRHVPYDVINKRLSASIRPLAGGKCRRFRQVTERYRFHRYLCFHYIFCLRVFYILFCTTKVTISYQNCIHSNSTLKSNLIISVPTAVPGNFELDESKEFSYRSASFKWDGVDESPNAMKGNFEGYEIRYWKGEMPEKVKVISIKPSQMGNRRGKRAVPKKVTATVSNLPPFSELYLEVVARNRFFESNASNQINITTPKGGRYWQCATEKCHFQHSCDNMKYLAFEVYMYMYCEHSWFLCIHCILLSLYHHGLREINKLNWVELEVHVYLKFANSNIKMLNTGLQFPTDNVVPCEIMYCLFLKWWIGAFKFTLF